MVPPENVRRRRVPVDFLRRVKEPLGPLVFDAEMWKPGQDAKLPQADRRKAQRPDKAERKPRQDHVVVPRDLRDPMTEEEIGVKFTALGGDVIGKDQCKKLQSFIMSMETAKDLGGLFELTTARGA